MAKAGKKTPARRSDEAPRDETRSRSEEASDGWLGAVLLHHAQIRRAFDRAMDAPADGSRLAAMKGLAVLLNGHSLAEEVVLYPVLATVSKAKGAHVLYAEQSDAKVQMAALERLDPADEAWAATLEEIRTAVEEHMREEEETWFPQISASGENQAKLTARYCEEFERYTRTGAVATNAAWGGPPRGILGLAAAAR